MVELLSKRVESALEFRDFLEIEQVRVKLLVGFIDLLLDIHHFELPLVQDLGFHEVQIVIVVLKYLKFVLAALLYLIERDGTNRLVRIK